MELIDGVANAGDQKYVTCKGMGGCWGWERIFEKLQERVLARHETHGWGWGHHLKII